jgi:hypothetical protein
MLYNEDSLHNKIRYTTLYTLYKYYILKYIHYTKYILYMTHNRIHTIKITLNLSDKISNIRPAIMFAINVGCKHVWYGISW